MADKKITELQLRDNVSADVNFPVDDGIQSYRVTAEQVKDFVLAANNVGTTQIADNAVTTSKIPDSAITTPKINDGAVTLAKLDPPVAGAFIPTGAVLPFAAATAPTGYLLCDGTAVSRTTYATLFALIGVTHGTGNGTTTFNLPDYRGRFLRGVDSGANRDPNKAGRTAMNTGGNTGDNVGSIQDDAMQGHRHPLYGYYMSIPGAGSHPVGAFTSGGSFTVLQASGAMDPISDGTNGTPRTSSESRPKNAGVNFIIKT